MARLLRLAGSNVFPVCRAARLSVRYRDLLEPNTVLELMGRWIDFSLVVEPVRAISGISLAGTDLKGTVAVIGDVTSCRGLSMIT